MTITTTTDKPTLMSALARYQQAIDQFAPSGAFWSEIGAHLRAEAETFTGDQRRKRLDRATDCDHRAANPAMR